MSPGVVYAAGATLGAAVALLLGKAWGEWRAREIPSSSPRPEAPDQRVPFIDLDACELKDEIVRLIPEHLARRHHAVAVERDGQRLTVALVDAQNPVALKDIALSTGLNALAAVATRAAVLRALDRFFPADDACEEIAVGKLKQLVDEPAIIRVGNLIISQALADRASDIHLEPQAKSLRVRYRVDGVLHEVMSPPKHIEAPLVARLKIMGNMDIAERRTVQYGVIRLRHEGRDYSLRVAAVPTVHGERMVLRILPKEPDLMGLARLGLSPQTLSSLEDILDAPRGLVLVTGPAGSGKTTTLCSCLHRLNRAQVNVLTVEDPVEHCIPGINQVSCNWKAGLDMASVLRHCEQQDADVVMVGEIRDTETARLAVEAARGRRVVLGALHTSSAAGALVRLVEMGVEPFMVASSVRAVLAQRLMRVVCPACRTEAVVPRTVVPGLAPGPEIRVYEGRGCERCKGTGYSGRSGVFELLVVTESVRQAVMRYDGPAAIGQAALEGGGTPLRQDAQSRVLTGQTSLPEYLRCFRWDDF